MMTVLLALWVASSVFTWALIAVLAVLIRRIERSLDGPGRSAGVARLDQGPYRTPGEGGATCRLPAALPDPEKVVGIQNKLYRSGLRADVAMREARRLAGLEE